MRRLRALHAALPGWVHGDVHLGNLLWRGLEVSGLVDFDDTRPGDHAWEVAMTLFALARRPDEDTFRYDRDLWLAGLAAYGDLHLEPAEHERAFCEYQVQIHETAVARGLWTLTDGIGYWPCKRALTDRF
jgi:Ser/Thr protein kinase RdoA (MazF antagonist)